MERRNYLLSFFIIISALLFVIIACNKEYEWDNPYDPDVDPKIWMPYNLHLEQSDSGVVITWEQDEKRIDGFTIARKIEDKEWVNSIMLPSPHTTIWLDTSTQGQGQMIMYKIAAFAGGNTSSEIKDSILPIFAITGGVPHTGTLSAQCVIQSGGNNIIEQGLYYGTDKENLTSGEKLASTKDTVSIGNLSDGTTYYYIAYATNGKITVKGDIRTFTTSNISLAQLQTFVFDSITYTTAVVGGKILSDGKGEISEKGIIYGLDTDIDVENTTKLPYTQSMDSFFIPLEDLEPGTEYFVRSYAVNRQGTAYGPMEQFTTMAYGAPVVSTQSMDEDLITSRSASISGVVTADNGQAVTQRGILLSLQPNISFNDAKLPAGNDTGLFSVSVDTLLPNVTYYVRAYASNSKGTGLGDEIEFTTLAEKPEVKLSSLQAISYTELSAKSEIIYDGGAEIIEKGICYSKNKFQYNDSTCVISTQETDTFSFLINSLEPGIKYYVKPFATNSAGTQFGQEMNVLTPYAELPELITLTVDTSEITSTSAVLKAEIVNDNGAKISEYGFVWDTHNLPTLYSNKIPLGSYSNDITFELTGLNNATKYYFRAYAISNKGDSYGDIISFSTKPNIPLVITGEISQNTPYYATFNGKINNDGNETTNSQGVIIGRSTELDLTNYLFIVMDEGTHDEFILKVSGLSPETVYFYRAFASNSAGTGYGEVKSFESLIEGKPQVITSDFTYIHSTLIYGKGEVINTGGSEITEKGVIWSNNENISFDNYLDKYIDTTQSFNYQFIIQNLQPETEYYYCTYAKNDNGISCGNIRNFKTKTNDFDNLSEFYVDMVHVEGGTFRMGCDAYGTECVGNSMPSHEVTLTKDFFINKYETTQKLWISIMGFEIENEDCENCPIVRISYNDITEFFVRINNAYPGYNFRLLTEAEWEFAADGGTLCNGYSYIGTSDFESIDQYGNICDINCLAKYQNSSANDGYVEIAPVGSFLPNEIGLFDMLGNVRELCSDFYGYYSDEFQIDPIGPQTGDGKVTRGSSYYTISFIGSQYGLLYYYESSYRTKVSLDGRSSTVGFRLAMDGP